MRWRRRRFARIRRSNRRLVESLRIQIRDDVKAGRMAIVGGVAMPRTLATVVRTMKGKILEKLRIEANFDASE